VLNIDRHIHVAGTGSYAPDNEVSNEQLEDIVRNYDYESGPFPEWVDRVTHIRSRRIFDPEKSSGDLAREACRQALDESGLDPSEIELFIMATFTTKNLYPGEQTMLVKELGMGNAATFYLTAACAGSVYGLQVANAFLRAGIYRHVLVVGTEHLTSVVDFGDPVTAILFGDGAGAVVLSRRDEPGPGGVLQHCVLGSNYVPGNIMMDNSNVAGPSRQVTVNGKGDPRTAIFREYIVMDGGPRVLRSAGNAMAEATVRSLGFEMKDLKDGNDELRELLDGIRLVPHQANGRILDGLRDKLRLRDEQVYKTLYLYGNNSAASNLLTLDYAIRRGNMRRLLDDEGNGVGTEEDVEPRIGSGDLVAIPSIGAGYLTGCFTYVVD